MNRSPYLNQEARQAQHQAGKLFLDHFCCLGIWAIHEVSKFEVSCGSQNDQCAERNIAD